MNTQSKLFFFAILLIIGVFSLFKYNQIVVNKNYTVYAKLACNPEVESCFVSDCDLNEADCNKDAYKKIERKAYHTGDCSAPDCLTTFCSEMTKAEGELCSFLGALVPTSTDISPIDELDGATSSKNNN